MPIKKKAPPAPESTKPKAGAEAIFIGPIFVTFLAGAAIVTGMSFDRWYMTSRINDITRYGLFQSCSYENCAANEFSSFVSTPSCGGSGSSWEARSIASVALIALGLFVLLISFLTNAAAAITRNIIYFFWTMLLMWLSLALVVAGGAVQYHLFGSHLFCGLDYCTYAQERYNDSRFCAEAFGMSTYLWFVGICMLGVNAIGATALIIVWRKRLSASWDLRNAQSRAIYVPPVVTREDSSSQQEMTSNNNRSSSSSARNRSSSRKRNPSNSNNTNNASTSNRNKPSASAAVAANYSTSNNEDIPEGYFWDQEAGYYFSEESGYFWDAETGCFYSPESDLWYNPETDVWE